MEVPHTENRPQTKVGKDAEEEVVVLKWSAESHQ